MPANSLYRSPEGEQKVMEFYDSMIDRWPVHHERLNISTRYGNTFAVACGKVENPALVLLHGAGSNALAWMGDAPGLSRYFRVFTVDIPGDPGRSAPNRLPWNSPAYAEWMEDVLNSLKIDKVILAGLSQGGWLAIKYASLHPGRVAKLVLLSPAGAVNDKFSFLLRAVLYTSLGKRGAVKINRHVFGNQPIHEDAVQFMNLIMTHFKPRISKLNIFTDADLRQLTMPVLLAGGKKDVIRDINKIANRMTPLVLQLSVKVYPDKGHVLVNIVDDLLPFLLAKTPIT